MSRLPRYVLPGYPQHVIQRGNNRMPIFLGKQDYELFWQFMVKACQRYLCRVHAYVFMTNHVHFIMTPVNENSISKVMQSVGTRYAQYFNARQSRTGAMWEGRYKATLIETDNYLWTCCRYIELNPVRAGVVRRPEDYQWSSYHANAEGKVDPLVTSHELLDSLGKGQTGCQAAYRALFNDEIDDATLDHIRTMTQKGWALGSERFQADIERLSLRQSTPGMRGGSRIKRVRPY